jgi:hypothetical protein
MGAQNRDNFLTLFCDDDNKKAAQTRLGLAHVDARNDEQSSGA